MTFYLSHIKQQPASSFYSIPHKMGANSMTHVIGFYDACHRYFFIKNKHLITFYDACHIPAALSLPKSAGFLAVLKNSDDRCKLLQRENK